MNGLRWALLLGLGGVPLLAAAQEHDFAYEVRGDVRVAPLQVFDDGERTFLQFRPDQPLPAVFVREQGRLRLVEHQAQGSYLVLPLRTDWIEVRIGTVLAQVHYLGSRLAQRNAAEAAPVSSVSPQTGFATAPEDLHLRGVLHRWARQTGWTFQPEHWAVDIDVPLAGQALLGSEFKEAVRALLRSTEMTRRPLQPCFYSNQVLRVIASTQSCQPGKRQVSS